MRKNNRKENYPAQYFRPGTNGSGPSSAIWGQGEQQATPFNRAISGNGRDGLTIPVPLFDWQASEALMKCYNG